MPLLEWQAALLISPAYAVGFAAMVCKPGAELSLLDIFAELLAGLGQMPSPWARHRPLQVGPSHLSIPASGKMDRTKADR
jgi:hypothetical protein